MKFGAVKKINSYRKVPFMGKLEKILKDQRRKQGMLQKELGERYRSTGEFADLVFVTSMGALVARYSAEKQINTIKKEVNAVEEIKAKKYGREPKIL